MNKEENEESVTAMKIEVPKFLLEMSKQMNEQDNRITEDPIWMVCYDKKHITEDGYGDFIEICDPINDYAIVFSSEEGSLADKEYAREYLYEREYCESVDDINIMLDYDDFDLQLNHFKREMEIVKACLTEADANWFIQRKQHDYPKLYTYVYSMCYCPQMIDLRNWILRLSKTDEGY